MTQKTILVVDDTRAMAEALETFFEAEGYRVATASDGIEALEVLASSALPDIVLLDVMMPRLDGYDTLSRMREHPVWQHIPVVLMSAATQPVDRARAGNVVFVHKPFDVVVLLGILEELLAATG